ncbi:hypothetical protein MMC28_002836 [Mycoblastus sanguinarius]|nr:hypothetical protein [Mycoblastus sanguinarius]
MDALLPLLLAFPPHPPPQTPLPDAEYDKQIKTLVQTLSAIPASKLTTGVPNGGDLLSILDPSINTLPYLFVLLAHIGGSSGKQKAGTISEAFAPGSLLWQKMLDFVERFDPVQIRYSGNEFRRLVELVVTKARLLSQPWTGIEPITLAILRVDPSNSTFTSSHLILVRLCLETRAFSAALQVLDLDTYHFPAATNKAVENSLYPFLCSNHESSSTFITPDSALSGKLDYREHLQYFLYGAMIYMGLKKWNRALLFLETVIMAPATTNASKIQVEAYKKWVLVGLLHKGCPLQMPKTTSSQVAKQYHAIARPYDALAETFKDGIKNDETMQKLISEAQAGAQFWNNDFNSGLVRQVIAAFRQFSVLQLEKTYAALTIAEVTRRTSPDPNDYAGTGQYVVHLICSGSLNASLSEPSEDPASWIVRFSDPTTGPLARSEEQQYESLAKQTRKVQTLMDHIREADRKLSLSKDYIAEAKKAKKIGPGGEAEAAWAMHNEGFDQDEDMMGDLT